MVGLESSRKAKQEEKGIIDPLFKKGGVPKSSVEIIDPTYSKGQPAEIVDPSFRKGKSRKA